MKITINPFSDSCQIRFIHSDRLFTQVFFVFCYEHTNVLQVNKHESDVRIRHTSNTLLPVPRMRREPPAKHAHSHSQNRRCSRAHCSTDVCASITHQVLVIRCRLLLLRVLPPIMRSNRMHTNNAQTRNPHTPITISTARYANRACKHERTRAFGTYLLHAVAHKERQSGNLVRVTSPRRLGGRQLRISSRRRNRLQFELTERRDTFSHAVCVWRREGNRPDDDV